MFPQEGEAYAALTGFLTRHLAGEMTGTGYPIYLERLLSLQIRSTGTSNGHSFDRMPS